jgi:hypothetical protein
MATPSRIRALVQTGLEGIATTALAIASGGSSRLQTVPKDFFAIPSEGLPIVRCLSSYGTGAEALRATGLTYLILEDQDDHLV